MEFLEIAYILILLLILILSFESNLKVWVYIKSILFLFIFALLFHDTNILLDLLMPSSVAVLYFSLIWTLMLVKIKWVIFLIIILIIGAFASYMSGLALPAQGIADYAFYAIIVFIIKVVSQSINNNEK